jgi:hypothetical protein
MRVFMCFAHGTHAFFQTASLLSYLLFCYSQKK